MLRPIVFFENMEDSVGKALSVCTHFDVITRRVGGQVVYRDESRLCGGLVKIGIRQDGVCTTTESIRAPPQTRCQTRFCSLPSSFHYEGEELVEHKLFLDVQPTPSANIEETQLLALILTFFVVAIAHTLQIECGVPAWFTQRKKAVLNLLVLMFLG